MVKCLRVYLHQAASLPDCQLCAVLWVLLKLSGGDGTVSHPGSVKRGDHIESTCCWRHMGRIRRRVEASLPLRKPQTRIICPLDSL
uniref:Uncharacterized protein n=1 Tax=Oreochromis aureus TaxID=47969 RepID=A0A668UJT5_OREAU